MTHTLSLVQTVAALAAGLATTPAVAAAAQQPIPLRRLGPVEATSPDTVGFVYGVRELSDGRLLANDAGARRLMLFDRSLGTARIIADSASGSQNPYGKRPAGIIPYLGDTTLLVDAGSRAFVVIGPSGNVTGVMSPPRSNDVVGMTTTSLGAARLDPKGRLVYRSTLPFIFRPPEPGKPFVMPAIPDSAPIIRADFDTRLADTLGWVRTAKIKGSATPTEGGGEILRALINPLSFIDDWAMLPDGSVAILRGRDYHIDWVNADGTRSSSPKMPFDWRRLTDDDKAAVIDSTKRMIAAQAARGGGGIAEMADHGGGAAGGHSLTILRLEAPDGGPAPKSGPTTAPTIGGAEVVPASELPDYMPPVTRSGNMVADLEGHVWILPSTSANSTGGLLYDVINRAGEVFQRVRLPAGRALVGFGANGAVYTTFRDATGQHLERARLQ